MTLEPTWYARAKELFEAGTHSALSIARCLDGVHYREVEEAFDWPPAKPKRFSDAYWEWHKQQPWVWRPDNREPIEAPWERLSREFY
jgi:hypothetical protein